MKTIIAVILLSAICSAFNGHRHHHQHEHHDHHHHHGDFPEHHGPHHMPPFLRNMTRAAKKEYFDILKKPDETVAQQKIEVMEWAKKHNVSSQVKQFEEDLKKHKDELKKNVTEVLNKVTMVHDEFTAIIENENQTSTEMRRKIDELRNSHPKEFEVMMFASRAFHPHHKRHHKRHLRKNGKKGDRRRN